MFGMGNKFGGGQPRPVPRPGTPAATAQPAAGGGGWFGNMSPQTRHDITMSLLANMQGYLGANASPTAHLLAPIATALLGARAESGLEAAKSRARDEAMRTLGANGLGGTIPADKLSALLGVAGSDMVDDPIRSLARSMITSGMRPVAAGAGSTSGRVRGSGSRGGGGSRGGSPGADPYASISASMAGNLLDASETVRGGIEDLMMQGMSAEEAEASLRSQPGYGPAFSLLDRYNGGGDGPAAPVAPVPEVASPPAEPAQSGRTWGQWWNGEDPAAPVAPPAAAPPPPPGTVPY